VTDATYGSEAERELAEFDHDAYVRAGLPNFVLRAMGLPPRPTSDRERLGLPPRDQPPPQPTAEAANPTRVRPRPADTRACGPRLVDAPGAARRGPQPPQPPPDPPLPPDAVTPANYARHLAVERAAHRAARVWAGVPLLALGLLLVAALAAYVMGVGATAPVVVEDEPFADCPADTLTPDELATERYWEC
jgi:hypothetical protein